MKSRSGAMAAAGAREQAVTTWRQREEMLREKLALAPPMGSVPDSTIARLVGCSNSVIGRLRRRQGIPTYAPASNAKLHDYLHLVGFLPDVEVARRAGVSRQRVWAYLQKRLDWKKDAKLVLTSEVRNAKGRPLWKVYAGPVPHAGAPRQEGSTRLDLRLEEEVVQGVLVEWDLDDGSGREPLPYDSDEVKGLLSHYVESLGTPWRAM